MKTTRTILPLALGVLLVAACGSKPNENPTPPTPDAGSEDTAPDAGTPDAGTETPDAGTETPDAGHEPPTTGTVRFVGSLALGNVKTLSVKVDGTALPSAFVDAAKAGQVVVFSAGVAEAGSEFQPGKHTFATSLTAPVQICVNDPGDPGGPGGPGGSTCHDEDATLDESLDFDVVAGRQSTVAVLYAVVNDASGSGTKLVGRITSVDTTAATDGELAAGGRLAVIRGPKASAYEGKYTIGFGQADGVPTVDVAVESDGVVQVPGGQAGTLFVTETGFFGPNQVAILLPAVAAGTVLPVVVSNLGSWNIPAESAGAGVTLAMP